MFDSRCHLSIKPVFRYNCNICCAIRLQYFARGSQTYHAQLIAALKDIDMLEMKKEQVHHYIVLAF